MPFLIVCTKQKNLFFYFLIKLEVRILVLRRCNKNLSFTACSADHQNYIMAPNLILSMDLQNWHPYESRLRILALNVVMAYLLTISKLNRFIVISCLFIFIHLYLSFWLAEKRSKRYI